MIERPLVHKTTTIIKQRWDLALLIIFCTYVALNSPQSLGKFDYVISIPLIFYGAGYPLAMLLPFPEGISKRRHTISIVISVLVTFILTYLSDIRLVIDNLALFTIITSGIGLLIRNDKIKMDVTLLFDNSWAFWNSFLILDKKKRYPLLISITILLLLIVSVWSIATTPPSYPKFTEFYVTGTDGCVQSIPKDIIAGDNYSVRIGIVNHEKHIIDYQVQIWLINSITSDNWTQVNNAYFIYNFTIRLLSNPPSLDNQWNSQFETTFTFNINMTGTYKLFFLLSKRGDPELPTNLTSMVDYAGSDIDYLINQARCMEIQSVNINLYINERESFDPETEFNHDPSASQFP